MLRWLISALLAAWSIQSGAGVMLSVSPASQNVTLGSPASIDINISGLGNGTALGTYDINLDLDPALLSYSSISFGDQLDLFGLGDVQAVTTGPGTVEVFELSLESTSDLNTLQKSAFRLATVTFNTLGVGSSPIILSVNALGDALGNPISADLVNGVVEVSANSIPEPSTLLLLLSSLSVLWVQSTRYSGKSPKKSSMQRP